MLKALFFYQNSPKIKLFLQKNAKFLSARGKPSDPRASGGWGLCPQTPSLRQLGIRPQTPKTAPPLKISGYAPNYEMITLNFWCLQFCFQKKLHHTVQNCKVSCTGICPPRTQKRKILYALKNGFFESSLVSLLRRKNKL